MKTLTIKTKCPCGQDADIKCKKPDVLTSVVGTLVCKSCNSRFEFQICKPRGKNNKTEIAFRPLRAIEITSECHAKMQAFLEKQKQKELNKNDTERPTSTESIPIVP